MKTKKELAETQTHTHTRLRRHHTYTHKKHIAFLFEVLRLLLFLHVPSDDSSPSTCEGHFKSDAPQQEQHV